MKNNGLAGPQDDRHDARSEGRVPGIAYAGGAQRQQEGLRGRRMSAFAEKWAKPLDDIDRAKCGAWANEDCLELVSRMIERTFRNMQITGRRPSHIDPPFIAKEIRVHPMGVNFLLTNAVAYIDLATFTVPAGARAEITAIGTDAESGAAFADLSWRILIDGTPLPDYSDIRRRLFELAPPTPLIVPIHLTSPNRIQLQVRSISGAVHQVFGFIGGWYYAVRTEVGPVIESTLVE